MDSITKDKLLNNRLVGSEKGIQDILEGRMIILVDDEDRENEGDLCCAAERVTPDIINFMARYGRGLICLSLTEEKADSLQLQPMISDNQCQYGTAFTVSIDSRYGITTGISARDRAKTILAAVSETAMPDDLVSPGHMFPLRAKNGGVLVRPGQTEGSVDLASLAGLSPAGVICEILNQDGTMARMPELIRFAQRHNLNIVSTADLIRYRLENEKLIRRIDSIRNLPFSTGDLKIRIYASDYTPGQIYICVIKGDIEEHSSSAVCIHKESCLSDIVGSLRRRFGETFERTKDIIAGEGSGIVIYIRDRDAITGLPINRFEISEDPAVREHACDTQTLQFKGDEIRWGIYANILLDLGARKVRLVNEDKNGDRLKAYGLLPMENIKDKKAAAG